MEYIPSHSLQILHNRSSKGDLFPICNQWVEGSIPFAGTTKTPGQKQKMTSDLLF